LQQMQYMTFNLPNQTVRKSGSWKQREKKKWFIFVSSSFSYIDRTLLARWKWNSWARNQWSFISGSTRRSFGPIRWCSRRRR
jgi:hypothetical protein